jgi:hypothetical protein
MVDSDKWFDIVDKPERYIIIIINNINKIIFINEYSGRL